MPISFVPSRESLLRAMLKTADEAEKTERTSMTAIDNSALVHYTRGVETELGLSLEEQVSIATQAFHKRNRGLPLSVILQDIQVSSSLIGVRYYMLISGTGVCKRQLNGQLG